jgi:acyl dehydratase
MPIIIQGIEGLKKLAGQSLGKSRWMEVSQDRINRFADVTEDWNWVHLDEEKAKNSPFKGTIAHGFLTMSLIIPLVHDIYQLEGIGMGLNYGFNRLRFVAAVPAGSKVRLDLTLRHVEDAGEGVQLTWDCIIECDRASKPAIAAEWLVRFYPSPDSRLS